MTEPDVALTDFGLALECGVFTILLSRRPKQPLRIWFVILFGTLALAAFLGGLYHGFLLGSPARLVDSIWFVIILAAGVTALSCWGIGINLLSLFPESTARVLFLVAVGAGYLVVAISVAPSFGAVLLGSSAAAMFLLVAYAAFYRRSRRPELLWGLSGVVLMLVAGVFQAAGLDLHPRFTHNALYHVLVGAAAYLIFRSAGGVLENPALEPS